MADNSNKILVCGGAGFIGSHFVDLAVSNNFEVVVLDALTYAGHEINLEQAVNSGKAQLVVGNICDESLVPLLFSQHNFSAVVNFAAESHVDRSIAGPAEFLQTNFFGTFNLLRHAHSYFQGLDEKSASNFRFLQVSTDEVFGELGDEGKFSEATAYSPRSPYSASKASADHLVNAWHHTYGLPTIITNCSNNYGPRQYPEKLIPLMITNAISDKALPVYGQGANIRDWIHVSDHCAGVWLALEKGKIGEAYCFGGGAERKNLDVVEAICKTLDETKPRSDGESYAKQIEFVKDRLGHDYRYAIDDNKAQSQLGYQRSFVDFEAGLKATIDWYLNNQEWSNTLRQR